jgi:uncharacterized protein (DUF488 family)
MRSPGTARVKMSSTVQDSSSETTSPTLWIIGHSTRSADEFTRTLKANVILNLVDVRSHPGSRRFPHFNKQPLSESIARDGMQYYHLPELGGRRRPSPNSHNTAWENPSFRAYADHMESAEFKEGINQLLILATERRTSIMCAEALWWRCHRSLIADYLKAIGCEVIHIVGQKKTEHHPFTSAARIIDGKLSYEGLFAG